MKMKKLISAVVALAMLTVAFLAFPSSSKAAGVVIDCSTNVVEVSTIDELIAECKANDGSKTIILQNDIIYNGTEYKQINVVNNGTLVLDMNGYNISVCSSATQYLFCIPSNSNVSMVVLNSKTSSKSSIQFLLENLDYPSDYCSMIYMDNYNADFTTLNVDYILNSTDLGTSFVKNYIGETIFNMQGGTLDIKGGTFVNYFNGNIVKYFSSSQCYDLYISGDTVMKSGNSTLSIYESGVHSVSIFDGEFYILEDNESASSLNRIKIRDNNTANYRSIEGENLMLSGNYSKVSIPGMTGSAGQISDTGYVNSGSFDLKFTSNTTGQPYIYNTLRIPQGDIYLDYETEGFAGIYSHAMADIEGTYVAPSCTSTGREADQKCKYCGYVVTGKELNALGHAEKTVTTPATAIADGKIVTTCENDNAVLSTTTIPKIASVKLSSSESVYDGKVKTPIVTVKDRTGKVLSGNTDYTVSYANGRKSVGKYAITVNFKGKYSGTKTLYYTIKPKGTSISSLTAGKKKAIVKWKKQKTQTTGYQIQYSTNSKFKSAKLVTVSKNKTVTKTLTKLKAKKKYYVRIRTYKTVKVNGKATKIYSSWSKAKKTTIK